ncbi:hypothetical protein ABER99_20075 [Paenibacillus glucanolyticus]|jgi:hypothetical protein|uniref:Uncharacterized protein n=1 Tax=Paenibacillus glucanolyticus TaxID=59843 RepID=A0A163GMY8_9BACL|nr:hypothetical protein [Paenibacillus glucanolyticus]KZS45052.1 hypothetical protein AWU65_03460 [Paenibacillus glucanolyticus]OMF63872.1 hypothetical protein BK142_32400 [Paenibacillus glucanolyticus]
MFFESLQEWWKENSKYKEVTYRMHRHRYYQLQMICDAINERIDVDYELTPEVITSRVMETFCEEAFSDSTNRIVAAIVPELKKKRRRIKDD